MENEKNLLQIEKNILPETQNEVRTKINKIVKSLSLDEVAMLEKAVGDLRMKMLEDRESDEQNWPEDMEKMIMQLYEKIWKIQSLIKKLHEEK